MILPPGRSSNCLIRLPVGNDLWLILATGDAVYMDNERSLEEYVLSQDGIIFRGTYKYPVPLPWNFGQVSRAKLTCPVTHMLSEK